MLNRYLLLLVFVTTVNANASNLSQSQFEFRWHTLPSQNDYIDAGCLNSLNLADFLASSVGLRLAISTHNIEHVDYKGEMGVIWKSLSAGLRLTHSIFTADHTASTVFLFTGGFAVSLFHEVGVFGKLGWYERFTHLSGISVLPFFWNNEFRDHDFALTFGIRLIPIPSWAGAFELSTFDELDVFRLNNPFFQLTIAHDWNETLTVSAFARYRLLLGFGRLDEFMLGLAAKYTL